MCRREDGLQTWTRRQAPLERWCDVSNVVLNKEQIYVRSSEATVRGADDDLFQSKRSLPDVLQQKVALGAFTAIDAFVVLQDILDPVQAWRIVSPVLTPVAAHNLHPQPSRHDLALVAILEARVLGRGAGVVLKLPSLVAALAVDLHNGAPGTGLGIRGGSEGVGDGEVAQRVEHVVGRVHVGGALFPDAGLRAAEVTFAWRGTGTVGVGRGRAPGEVVYRVAITWGTKYAVE